MTWNGKSFTAHIERFPATQDIPWNWCCREATGPRSDLIFGPNATCCDGCKNSLNLMNMAHAMTSTRSYKQICWLWKKNTSVPFLWPTGYTISNMPLLIRSARSWEISPRRCRLRSPVWNGWGQIDCYRIAEKGWAVTGWAETYRNYIDGTTPRKRHRVECTGNIFILSGAWKIKGWNCWFGISNFFRVPYGYMFTSACTLYIFLCVHFANIYIYTVWTQYLMHARMVDGMHIYLE